MAEPSVVGWIGAGVMGKPMAGHLLQAGYRLRVYTRTPAKATDLVEQGATWCSTPAEVARDARFICTMVGLPEDVEAVSRGENGLLKTAPSGSIWVDFTTSRPSLARQLAEEAAEGGVEVLDAPVSGGDVGARQGRLSIMVGGADHAVEQARPLLACFGATIGHQGGPGAGQDTKMVNQILVAGTMIGTAEALLYARGAGLDPDQVLMNVRAGAAGSWSLENLWPRMVREDWAPGFMIEHFVKDMGIALEEARARNVNLPGLEQIEALYRRWRDAGHGDEGTQALYKVVEALSEGTM